jgi:cell division protein FtsW (lipid II flippase)
MELLFQSFYFKLSIASIMALLLTFSGDIEIFRDQFILLVLFVVLILMIMYNIRDDLGLVMLLIALLVITYNNVITKSIIKTSNVRIKDDRSD